MISFILVKKKMKKIKNEEIIKKNINYSVLIRKYPPQKIDLIVQIILDTISNVNTTLVIEKLKIPTQDVQDRMLQVDMVDVEYILLDPHIEQKEANEILGILFNNRRK